jgi:hypothetical protein
MPTKSQRSFERLVGLRLKTEEKVDAFQMAMTYGKASSQICAKRDHDQECFAGRLRVQQDLVIRILASGVQSHTET